MRPRETWALTAGTYFISATTLQARYGEHEESVYQALRQIAQPLLDAMGTPDSAEVLRRFPLAQWHDVLVAYEGIRHARLTAFLRSYSPDDFIGYSILVFSVSQADITEALDGPAPLGRGYLERTLREQRMK